MVWGPCYLLTYLLTFLLTFLLAYFATNIFVDSVKDNCLSFNSTLRINTNLNMLFKLHSDNWWVAAPPNSFFVVVFFNPTHLMLLFVFISYSRTLPICYFTDLQTVMTLSRIMNLNIFQISTSSPRIFTGPRFS